MEMSLLYVVGVLVFGIVGVIIGLFVGCAYTLKVQRKDKEERLGRLNAHSVEMRSGSSAETP